MTIQRIVLLLGSLVVATQAPALAQQPAPQRWEAYDNASISIIGNITFSPSRITFANRKSLALTSAGRAAVQNMNGGPGTATADLFRVTQPDDPVLLGGNRLCGGKTPVPVTYIAVWRPAPIAGLTSGPDRQMAVFSSATPPTTATQQCGQYGFSVSGGR